MIFREMIVQPALKIYTVFITYLLDSQCLEREKLFLLTPQHFCPIGALALYLTLQHLLQLCPLGAAFSWLAERRRVCYTYI